MAAGGLLPQSKPAPPRAAGGSISGTRLLLCVLLLTIAVAAVVAVFVTASSGQTNLAIIIGIFSAAFFSRVMC
ncbi:MAG: hypothetical protein U0Q20_11185 [Mycobacterium sp.]|nr:hypothetical protein [Mycobacterium sp.]